MVRVSSLEDTLEDTPVGHPWRIPLEDTLEDNCRTPWRTPWRKPRRTPRRTPEGHLGGHPPDFIYLSKTLFTQKLRPYWWSKHLRLRSFLQIGTNLFTEQLSFLVVLIHQYAHFFTETVPSYCWTHIFDCGISFHFHKLYHCASTFPIGMHSFW
jgi:hypothetical protein